MNASSARRSDRSSPLVATFAMLAMLDGGIVARGPIAVARGGEVVTAAGDRFSDADLVDAYRDSHDGYSSDEVLLDDQLRGDFLTAVSSRSGIPASALDEQRVLVRLLQLRKSGRLDVVTTRRRESASTADQRVVAEIAARVVMDRHRVSSDDLLTHPRWRDDLDAEARKLVPDVDAYAVRKALLTLRKTRRLRPELVLRVAHWDRDVRTLRYADLDAAEIPSQPGVYLFRDSQGYAYIGEAADLRTRLNQHRAGSHNDALARWLSSQDPADMTIELHVFAADSPAAAVRVRRAYESELIRSRSPRFNLQP